MALTKESLVSLKPLVRKVELPEIGDAAYVRMLSVADRLDLEKALTEREGKPVHGIVLAFTLTDENGSPLFSVDETDVIDRLPAPVMDRLLREASSFNKLVKTDTDAAEKNS